MDWSETDNEKYEQNVTYIGIEYQNDQTWTWKINW